MYGSERLFYGDVSRRSTSGAPFPSTATGERLSLARASQPEDPSVQTPRLDPSPRHSFDPRGPLSNASDRPLSSVIQNDLAPASNACALPKMAQIPPMVAGIEFPAGGTSSDDAGDEERAPTHSSPQGLQGGRCNGCSQRLWSRGGGPSGWRGRRAGPTARAGGPGGWGRAGGACGPARDAPTACVQHADVGTRNLLLLRQLTVV